MVDLVVKKFNSFTEIPNIASPYLFQSLSFQKLFSDNFIEPENLYWLGVYEGNNLLAIANFEKIDNRVILIGMRAVLGNQELTDFGDIIVNNEFVNQQQKLIEIWGAVCQYFKNQAVRQIRLDYVRDDSIVYKIYSKDAIKQQVSPFIKLPSSWDEYLSSLDRIKRKELKRKIKRLETQPYQVIFEAEINKQNFDDFIFLHRASDPAKNKFMSQEMKNFFWQLVNLNIPNWQTKLSFLTISNKKVSSVLYFINNEQILLYNSGFDPEYSFYSVGLLLKAYLIKYNIEKGIKIFDFLRGNERYKYDLGARDRNLYQIKIEL